MVKYYPFKFRRINGELEIIPYQVAFGISIKYLTCKGMGVMIRMYFICFKLWFNIDI